MSDNVAPSTDPTVATDDVAGVHYQKVKLFDGTADSTAAIPGDASLGLRVAPVGTLAHDAPGTGANPLLQGGYASAAAPSDVSADGDAVRAWRLRNGAAAMVLTAAGALIGGDAANGMDVDVTRMAPPTDATASGNITTQNLNPTSGTATAGSTVALTTGGLSAVAVQVTGTYSGALTVQGTVDNANWVPIAYLVPIGGGAVVTSIGSAVVGIWLTRCAGLIGIRVTALGAVTGTAVVSIRGCVGPAVVALDNSLPAGSASIGSVTIASGATSIAKAEDVGSNDADVGVGMLAVRKATPANTSGSDGDYEFVQMSGGRVWVSNDSAGDIAHDGVDSGNPVKQGAVAIAHGTNPTAVAAADRTNLYASRHGIPFHIGGHPNVITYGMSLTTAVSNTVIGPTIGAGLKLVVTRLTLTLDNASTVFPTVTIGFGTANTPAFATTPGTAGVLAGHPAVPAGGGFNIGDGSGIIGVGADNEELRITTVGNAGGAGIYVSFSGYTVES